MQRKSKPERKISIIIPAYKKEKTIYKDIKHVEDVLKNGLPEEFDFEIICVVDGELDQTKREASRARSKRVKVYSYAENKGKGFAVRYGMKRSTGSLISFLDAGMEISPKGIMMLLAHMDWYNADIIVGSKRHPVSMVNYPPLRKILSIGYHRIVKLLFSLNVTDTQSGIKIFKREVVEKILPRLLVKRYAMDIEMLAVARQCGFKRIFEGPIEVHFDDTTSTVSWATVYKMAWDTLAVFYRLRILNFYDDSNKKNWIKL